MSIRYYIRNDDTLEYVALGGTFYTKDMKRAVYYGSREDAEGDRRLHEHVVVCEVNSPRSLVS